MSTDLERQDIEAILKEIYTKKYQGFFYHATLYYKMKGKHTDLIDLSSYSGDITDILNIILNQNIEWELYVDHGYVIEPTKECELFDSYCSAVGQFIMTLNLDLLDRTTKLLLKTLTYDDKDPLTQILSYGRFLLKRPPQRSYFCFYVELAIPPSKGEDPTSIFHGREGIIAYCTTFANLSHLSYADLETVISKLKRLYWDAIYKKLGKYWKLCDIERIESIIHDEIEKANQLMREYGIIRVAFPLS